MCSLTLYMSHSWSIFLTLNFVQAQCVKCISGPKLAKYAEVLMQWVILHQISHSKAKLFVNTSQWWILGMLFVHYLLWVKGKWLLELLMTNLYSDCMSFHRLIKVTHLARYHTFKMTNRFKPGWILVRFNQFISEMGWMEGWELNSTCLW